MESAPTRPSSAMTNRFNPWTNIILVADTLVSGQESLPVFRLALAT